MLQCSVIWIFTAQVDSFKKKKWGKNKIFDTFSNGFKKTQKTTKLH